MVHYLELPTTEESSTTLQLGAEIETYTRRLVISHILRSDGMPVDRILQEGMEAIRRR